MILEAHFVIAAGHEGAEHDRLLGHQVCKLLKLRVISGTATRDHQASDQTLGSLRGRKTETGSHKKKPQPDFSYFQPSSGLF
jgi:hypothetical protein